MISAQFENFEFDYYLNNFCVLVYVVFNICPLEKISEENFGKAQTMTQIMQLAM